MTLSSPFRGLAEGADRLAAWKPGMLDIHHLAYGRGNSTFFLFPDGTTMLVDAGTTEDPLTLSCAQKPNSAMRPGEWIASYILRQMQPTGRKELDYALITHLHPDHLGDVGRESPQAVEGDYRLTGITDVDARVPIRTLIDRGFSQYDYPTLLPDVPYAQNYLAYVRERVRLGKAMERIVVGSATQIRLLQDAARYPSFAIRNLTGNGEVWTGVGEQARATFPRLGTLDKGDYPTENMCSIAIRVGYGKFDYFTGGDLTSDIEESGEAWRDIETAAAQAAGPVEVAVADHHAFFDAVGVGFVRALRPEVFVIPSWYVGHPSIRPLRRMSSQRIYPGDRDIYATCLMDANRLVNALLIGKVKSPQGHIVVRVAAGGDEFRVFVTSNDDDSDRVAFASGPYRCR